jgi:hypothetical protein
LILDLGSYDIILGRKWLAFFNILVDARQACLAWPRELSPSYSAAKEIKVLRTSLYPGAIYRLHQRDTDARDRAIALEDQSLATLLPNVPGSLKGLFGRAISAVKRAGKDALRGDVEVKPGLSEPPAIAATSLRGGTPLNQPRRSQLIDSKESLRKIDAILKNNWRTEAYVKDPIARLIPKAKARSRDIEISTIGAYAYRLHTQNPENEAFLTSFYEIDCILEDRYQSKATNASAEQINAFQEAPEPASPALCMPERYRDYKDVASKEASNVLLPHCIYDYRIDLTKPNELGYSPLYKITTAELEETKRYILDNLHKGFIKPSQVPFAALILFVKKADRSLRLCVNYRKLNEISRKDRYPLPLIDELLA